MNIKTTRSVMAGLVALMVTTFFVFGPVTPAVRAVPPSVVDTYSESIPEGIPLVALSKTGDWAHYHGVIRSNTKFEESYRLGTIDIHLTRDSISFGVWDALNQTRIIENVNNVGVVVKMDVIGQDYAGNTKCGYLYGRVYLNKDHLDEFYTGGVFMTYADYSVTMPALSTWD